jgi:hypothetical protein
MVELQVAQRELSALREDDQKLVGAPLRVEKKVKLVGSHTEKGLQELLFV